MNKPILITTSDWHLRSTVPVSRLAKCWYSVMESRIEQLKHKYPDVPIAIAGDLFDRPDPPSSLVSWAISILQGMEIYAIPGQHDLPYHRYQARDEGAYGALIKAGTIKDLPAYQWTVVGNMSAAVAMYSMPWEHYAPPKESALEGPFRLALMHKYLWTDASNAYVGADQDTHVVGMTEHLKQFDLIAVGDNHIPWKVPKIVNHGSLFSMTSAQVGHVPLIGIVYEDGTYKVEPFPEIDVQWQPTAISQKVDSVMESLSTMTVVTAGFRETISTWVEQSNGQERVLYEDLLDHLASKD